MRLRLLALLLVLGTPAIAGAVAGSQHAAIGIVATKTAGITVAIGAVQKSPANPLFDQTEPWESDPKGSINNG